MEKDELANDEPEKEEPTPKCLENRVSVKGAMLHAAEVICQTTNKNLADGDSPCELILLTNCGIVQGVPASDEEYSIKDSVSQAGEKQYRINLFSLGYHRDIVLNALQQNEPNQKAIDCGSYICLKNVTVLNNGVANKFDELIVFADQVSGVSIGRNS